MASPSYDDLYDLGKAEMLTKRPDLFLYDGDVSDFIIAAAAAMADKNTQDAAEKIRNTFLDTSSGDKLTTLVDDHWGIQRQPATQATVILTFSRSAGGLPSGTISAGTTVATVEDTSGERQEYTTDDDVSWSASESGSKQVGGTAVESGVAGNVATTTIVVIVDTIFDSNITVSNSAAAAGGNDEESDDQLRERTRVYPSTIRRGTLSAIEYGALTVASVRVATVTEDIGTGLVTVYITDENGSYTAEMIVDVEEELEEWRAAGIEITVTGGVLVTQNVDVSLVVKPGVDVNALSSVLETAVDERMKKLSIGETLRREMISTAIMNVRPDQITGVTVNTPVADVEPDSDELIRLGTFTIS